MKIPIIDMGHGYMIAGQYQTAGKRSPNWNKGIIYEGVSNKHFGNDLMKELIKENIPFYICNPEPEDIGLSERVRRADKIYLNNPNTYLLSLHSNAGGGTGFEGFTSKGQTSSDAICEEFLKDIKIGFPDLILRTDPSDGDLDKEVDYQILKFTKGPALLLEILFMDNTRDYDLLWDCVFRKRVVQCLKATIIKLYNEQ